MGEFLILAIVAVYLFKERGDLRRRLTLLEEAVDDLRRSRRSESRPEAPATTPSPVSEYRRSAWNPPTGATAPPTPLDPPAVPAAAAPVPSPASAPPTLRSGEAFADEAAAPAPRAWTSQPVANTDSVDIFSRWPLSVVRDFFTGGNLVVRGGVVILFIGVAFLLRYAAEHTNVPIEWRLTGAAAGAIILLGLGWRWRETRRNYALALQGGAVGILYLIVFAALRLYQLLTPGFAFALLAAIAALSAILAITQNSLAFAMLGAGGGFAAPLLTSTGQGNYIALFTYYSILDVAILAIAWFRSWRLLNLTAFAFTYVIGIAWGVLRYQPENLATTEPFLIGFFLIFVAISVLFALRQAPELAHYVDGTLVFGVPVLTMGIQSALVRHIPYALAYSAVALAAFYLLLGWQLLKTRRDTLRLLVESYVALGVAFATLAIPCALQGRWTAASWALEGAALLWVGLRQDRRLPTAAGLLLQVGAGVAYFVDTAAWRDDSAAMLLANNRFVAAALISAAGLTCALLLRRHPTPWLATLVSTLSGMLWFWALAWLVFAGWGEIERQVPASMQAMSALAWFAATAVVSSLLGARVDWQLPRGTALLLWPVLAWWCLTIIDTGHPSAQGGWWAWPLSLAAGYWILRRDDSLASAPIANGLHALAVWLVTFLVTTESHWHLTHWVPESTSWALAVTGLLPALVLMALSRDVLAARWPRRDHVDAYRSIAALGLGVYLVAWIWIVNAASDGTATPLPYIPLLNPIDATQALSLLVLTQTLLRWRATGPETLAPLIREGGIPLLVFTGFLWLNTLLFRVLHHRTGVEYDLDALLGSTLVQTALTIFWTVLALLAMVWATRYARRLVWFAGAGLLGVVVAKLFLVDLSRTGTVARIVSFVGVGILMLVVGYFSPLPPRKPEGETV